MEFKGFGENLARLRKKAGLTQQQLADKLGFSNKTISKWETGETLPEITVLPKLAAVFAVTVDYLIMGERSSVAFLGDVLVDRRYEVEAFPREATLANIIRVSQSIGGCAPCTAVNLAKIDRSVPIFLYGCVGEDDDGRYVNEILRSYNINVNSLRTLPNLHTGFCEEMCRPEGERMFFYFKGANRAFSPEYVDMSLLQCSILHVGYLLVLDGFEVKDDEYGSLMARFLKTVQDKGIKVSADIASKSHADWSKNDLSVLKYVNYLICNEQECCACFGLNAKNPDDTLNTFNIKIAMRKAIQAGVRDKVVVHTRDVSYCLNSNNEFTEVASLDIPERDILSQTGAGDAFCAGCLFGINNGFSDKEMLEFASAAGAANLYSENSVDGMRDKKQLLQMIKDFPKKTI